MAIVMVIGMMPLGFVLSALGQADLDSRSPEAFALAMTDVQAAVSSLPPHPLFRVLTPSVGFFAATAILGFSVAFGPYLRGERWAWWALLLADLAVILANVWGTLTIYVHSLSNGIVPELWFPLALVALAVLLSWGDFNSLRRAGP